MLARGDDPPEPPGAALRAARRQRPRLLVAFGAFAEVRALVLARGDDPPEPPGALRAARRFRSAHRPLVPPRPRASSPPRCRPLPSGNGLTTCD
jgi:hypothetical protein